MLSGNKMMFLRIAHNLSQKHIAECLGVSREYISMIENGKKPMSKEIYQKFLDAIYGKLLPSNALKSEEDINKPVEKSATVEPEKPTTAKKSTKKTSKAKG